VIFFTPVFYVLLRAEVDTFAHPYHPGEEPVQDADRG
jgi:hypothetical protein